VTLKRLEVRRCVRRPTHLPDLVRNLDLNSRSADFSSAKGLQADLLSQHQQM
jgi:hypothetical protein